MERILNPQKGTELIRREPGRNGQYRYVITQPWFDYFQQQGRLLSRGFSGTVTIAKLTGGGANGTLTFENGILVNVVQAT